MKRNISLFMTGLLLLALSSAQGQEILQPLSTIDQRAAKQSFQAALEYNTTGIAANWQNPDANISGMTEPVKTLHTTTGQSCREFHQSITVDTRVKENYGTACRQSNGNWQIVDPTTLQPVVKKTIPLKKIYIYESPRRYYPYRYPNGRFLHHGYPERYDHYYFDRHRRSRFEYFDSRWRWDYRH